MKKALFLAAAAVFTLVFSACNNEDYLLYDTTQQDAVFIEYKNASSVLVDTITYNFGYDPAEEYSISLPVRLVGAPKDYDRALALDVVDSLSSMTAGTHYEVDSTTLRLPAGAVSTVLKLKLLRSKDTSIQQKARKLVFNLKNTADLRPFTEKNFTITYSDIRPTTAPVWWNTRMLPPYTFELAQRFFYWFYKTEAINPTVFNELITRYGDYFINYASARKVAGQTLYDNFVVRYVLLPMYQETQSDASVVWPAVPALY